MKSTTHSTIFLVGHKQASDSDQLVAGPGRVPRAQLGLATLVFGGVQYDCQFILRAPIHGPNLVLARQSF